MDINFAAASTAGLNNPGTEIITLVKDESSNFINPPSYDKMLAYLRSGDVPCLFVTDATGTTGDIYQLSGYSETENKIRFAGEKTAIEFSDGSDAPVETEIEGGGAAITDGIVVKARDADGHATEIDYYNSEGVINSQEFFTYAAKGFFAKTSTINVKNAITSVKGEAFRGSAFTKVNLPDVTDVTGGDNFREMSHVTQILLPKVTSFHNGQYIFYSDNALAFVQLGSIGNALTAIRNNTFSSMTAPATIEVYTTGTYADGLLANIRYGATKATIIIKASEATTYSSTAYNAGDTMITSEVA